MPLSSSSLATFEVAICSISTGEKCSARVTACLIFLPGRYPYPAPLGVVAEGALADLLIVNGNPLEDVEILASPADNLLLIMKDGRVFKNTLP